MFLAGLIDGVWPWADDCRASWHAANEGLPDRSVQARRGFSASVTTYSQHDPFAEVRAEGQAILALFTSVTELVYVPTH
jgi:hypothetical protein